MTGGRERIRYADPYPVGDALVRDGIDVWDSDANKDGGGAVFGRVVGDGGVGG